MENALKAREVRNFTGRRTGQASERALL